MNKFLNCTLETKFSEILIFSVEATFNSFFSGPIAATKLSSKLFSCGIAVPSH